MPKYRNKHGFFHFLPVENEPDQPSPEDFANGVLLKRQITQAMLMIQPREERLLRLHYGLNCRTHSLADIAQIYGITPARVVQILNKSLRKLRCEPTVNLISANNKIVYDDRENWDEFEVRFGIIPYQL